MRHASRAHPTTKMATHDSLKFVEAPPEDVWCPVCMTVMRNPHLLSCCGRHVCRDCVSKIERDRKPCPLCREGFTSLLDKGLQRKVDQLKVHCPHHELGCEWIGRLSKSEGHLNPAEAEADVECQFQEIPCGYGCGRHIQRRSLREHENSECPFRPSECEYCGNYRGTYTDLQSHWSGCEHYPVPCPNQCCSETWPRCKLKNHLQNECPLEVVGCSYGLAGCTVQRARKDMPTHMKVQGDFHSSLVLKQNMELQRRLEEQGTQMQQLTEQFQQISSEFENGCQQRIANLGAEKQVLQAEVTQLRQNLDDKNQMLQAEVTQLRQNLGEENQVLKADITQLREEQGALLKQLHEMKEQIKHQQSTASVLERELVQQSELCKKEKQTLTSQVQTLGKQQQGGTDGLRQEIQALKQEQSTQIQQLTEQFQKISSEFENGCQRIANLGDEKQALQAEVTQLRQTLGDKNQVLQAEVTQLRQNLGEENQVLKAEITRLREEQQQQREEQGALLKQLQEMKKQIVHQQGTASVLERELVQQSELCKKEKQTLTSQVQTLGEQQQGVTDELRQEIQALKQDVCYVETCITPIPPFPFTVNRYSERMNSKEVFISSPFYTHRRGYKMTIRVEVNDSKGHVSVFCCIMRGEHDDSLKWPFHGDVCIRLLDHTDSQNHFEKFICFDQRTPLSRSGKVTSGDKGFLHGHDNFIAHKDLNYNSVNSDKYIEGNALDFEVTSVTVANVM